MILDEIKLKGFLSYRQEQTVRFDNTSLCLVTGMIESDPDESNGAGKSSLFEAMLVCFFGRIGGRGENLDNYINDDSDFMSIRVDFRMDKVRYRCIRTKNRGGGGKQEIYRHNGKKWTTAGKKIEHVLGLSYETFSSTVYLNEGESLKFIDGSGSERKEIFRELLNINIYEQSALEAKSKVSDLEKKINVDVEVVRRVEARLAKQPEFEDEIKQLEKDQTVLLEKKDSVKKQYDKAVKVFRDKEVLKSKQDDIKKNVADSEKQERWLKNQIDVKNDTLESITNDVEEEKRSFDRQQQLLLGYKKSLNDNLSKIDTLNKAIVKLNKKCDESDNYDTKLSELQDERRDLESSLYQRREKKKDLIRDVRKVESFDSICPVLNSNCSVIDKSYKDTYVSEREEQIKKLELESVTYQKLIDTNASEIKVVLEQKRELELVGKEIENKKDNVSQLKLNNAKLEGKVSKIESQAGYLDKFIESKRKQYDSLLDEIDDLETQLGEIQETIKVNRDKVDPNIDKSYRIAEADVDKLEEGLEEIGEELNIISSNIAINRSELSDIEKEKKEVRLLSEGIEKLRREVTIYSNLVKFFGKNGIQKEIMKTSVPYLEQVSNNILQVFNKGSDRLQIKFELDPRTASGELRKRGGLEISIVERDKEPKNLKMYSGGEKVRIVFSIVLGLSKFLSRRSGKQHETLIIDEKIAKLDRRGIEKFSEIMNMIYEWYEKTFIITHIESLKDLITQSEIVVNKTSEGSKVTINY